MTNSITKNLHLWFSRLMSCSSSPLTTSNNPPYPDSAPSSPSPPSPTTSSSSVVFKNYNSLYDPAAASSDSDIHAASNSVTFTATTAAPTTDSDSDPDLSSAIASRRLLPPSSPGRSNAIADPTAISVGIGVAVPTYSPDPYGDFRTSMEEMAVAMGLLGPRGPEEGRGRRREQLYELLLCYLALNRKHAHKYIVGAFADLLVALAEKEGEEEDCSGHG